MVGWATTDVSGKRRRPPRTPHGQKSSRRYGTRPLLVKLGHPDANTVSVSHTQPKTATGPPPLQPHVPISRITQAPVGVPIQHRFAKSGTTPLRQCAPSPIVNIGTSAGIAVVIREQLQKTTRQCFVKGAGANYLREHPPQARPQVTSDSALTNWF